MPCDYTTLPHPGIRTLLPYLPGKSAETLAREQGLANIIKLASNENPLGCSPLVMNALANVSPHTIATYPTSINHPLRAHLAETLNISPNKIMFGNGSDALFGMLLTCFALHTNKHMLTHAYAFSSYAIQAHTLGIPVNITPATPTGEVDMKALQLACNEQTALIFMANPNNPTGLFICPAEIEALLNHIPKTTLLVLDEAYYEYLPESNKTYALTLLSQHKNLVITRTFSKAYGLAGLRLGYVIADEAITALLYKIQLPFAVNITAMLAASAALDDRDFLNKTLTTNQAGIKQMQRGLRQFNLPLWRSLCNFITFDCKTNALPLYEALQDYGIIVRPLHPYGLPNHLRVTIGTEEQNARFLNTLSAILGVSA